jgi:hypothetical protein
MLKIRLWHSYLSLITAPSIMFFALTGTVQIFDLHEAHGGYHPPAVLEKLGRLHKDQEFALKPERHAPPPAAFEASPPGDDHDHAGAAHDDGDGKNMLPIYLLKWFFTLVAISLTISAGLGLYIGLTNSRRARVSWILVAIGTALPVALAMM